MKRNFLSFKRLPLSANSDEPKEVIDLLFTITQLKQNGLFHLRSSDTLPAEELGQIRMP